jgi:hypothetical protein
MSKKSSRGQFFTVNSKYVLQGLTLPQNSQTARCVIEPFAGKGDLLSWLEENGNQLPVEAYDIEPQRAGIQQRDTLANPPDYSNAYVITNPPFLARNRSVCKRLFDQWDTDDLFKCFLLSLCRDPAGVLAGIIVLPAQFFSSMDPRCRHAFLSTFKVTRVNYFQQTVFPDATTTVVAIMFARSMVPLTEQSMLWVCFPKNERRTFHVTAADGWIIGGNLWSLPVSKLKVSRYVKGSVSKLTSMTLRAIDSGKLDGRIRLEFKKGYVSPAGSRAYATLCVRKRLLTEDEQRRLCEAFNQWVEQKRTETCSLFLSQFRESKEYARKRIPFKLAYKIVAHVALSLRM